MAVAVVVAVAVAETVAVVVVVVRGSGNGRGDVCGDSGETTVNGYNSTLIWILSLSCLCLPRLIFT